MSISLKILQRVQTVVISSTKGLRSARTNFSTSSGTSSSTPALIKKSTGIVGLDVEPRAQEVLIELYTKTLRDVKELIPEGNGYRQAVEQLATYRLEVCKTSKSFAEIEARIGRGQVEELIEQAKSELQLIPSYASWKFWKLEPIKSMEDEDSATFSSIYEQLEGQSGERLQGNMKDRQVAQKREKQAREAEAAKAIEEQRLAAEAAAKAKAAAAAAAVPPTAAPAKKA